MGSADRTAFPHFAEWPGPAVKFRGRRLIELDFAVDVVDRLKQTQRPDSRHLSRRDRLLKGHTNEALRRQIVNEIRLGLFKQAKARAVSIRSKSINFRFA